MRDRGTIQKDCVTAEFACDEKISNPRHALAKHVVGVGRRGNRDFRNLFTQGEMVLDLARSLLETR